MADNPSPSPLISQNPSLQIPRSPSSLDLPSSMSSPQLASLHPQNPSANPNSNSNLNPSAMSSTFQNLQRAGSMTRLAQLQQQLGAAMTGRGGGGQQLPMLPGQSVSQFNNMQSQLMLQPQQKAALVQGMQFNSTNSPGQQSLQGMQAMGTVGSLGMNSQLRGNIPLAYGQQRFNSAQLRQQMSLQTPLTSPQKLPGQSLPRGSSLAALNPQFPGLTQNGQSAFVQNMLSQQQMLKHIQPAVVTPASPSHHLQQRQQLAFSQHQLSTSQLQQQKSVGLNQQQISQLVQMQQQKSTGLSQQQISQLVQMQQQKSTGLSQQQISQLVQHTQLASPQQHQPQQQQLLQRQQLQQLQQQQQSPRTQQVTGFQKSISLTGSQPVTPAFVTTTTGGNSSQETEASNQLLGKRKIQELVSQVDSLGKLDPDVEDLLLEMADDFIDSVTTFACNLAKHRKSSTLESKDLLLHLDKNWQLKIPGFTREGQNYQKESLPDDIHRKRLEMVRALMESQKAESDSGGARDTTTQVTDSSALDHPATSSEQLVLSSSASQMLQKGPQI